MPKTQKVAVVAGGSAGVGRAVVTRLLDDNYAVAILARGEERLRTLEQEYGNGVVCLPCDVADAERVARAGAAIEEMLGPIDVWVNSAMLTSFSPFQSMGADEFERIVDTTFIGVVNGTRTALARMQARNRGRIVNVGSGLAYRSVPYQSAYCASKHAINGFTAALRSELIRQDSQITLSLVQLPALNTPQFDWALNRLSQRPQPAPPIFDPDVAARAVMRAIDEGKREYFVGRSAIQLILGNMVFPSWMDRKLADSGAEMQKSSEDDPGDRPNNLHAPVSDVAPTAEGRFGDRASDRALIVDADRLRLLVFAALPVIGLIVGLIIG
ncbi:MAG: SDR family oxidoreductase [Paracoccaceae bacterium]